MLFKLAVTCAHCVYTRITADGPLQKVKGDMFLCDRLERRSLLPYERHAPRSVEDQELVVPADVTEYPVKCVYSHQDMDVAFLQIIDPGTFPSVLSLVPVGEAPRSAKEEVAVKVYQAPLTVFETNRLPVLEISPSSHGKLTLFSNHHFWVELSTGPGSSGSPVVRLSDGAVVGWILTGWQPDFPVELMMDASEDDDRQSTWSGSATIYDHITQWSYCVKSTSAPDSFTRLLALL